jgi:DNA-binding MarR family transcriptional regulator
LVKDIHDVLREGRIDSPAAQKLLEAFIRFRRAGWRQSPIGGLTPSEVMILSYLVRATKEEPAGIKVSDISNFLQVAPPTITQQVNNLERQGYVDRNIDKEDRRAVRIRLTEQGSDAIERAHKAFHASLAGLVAYLGEEQSEQLADLLTRTFTYFHERKDASD